MLPNSLPIYADDTLGSSGNGYQNDIQAWVTIPSGIPDTDTYLTAPDMVIFVLPPYFFFLFWPS